MEKRLVYTQRVAEHPKANEIFNLLKGFSGHVSIESNLVYIKEMSIEDFRNLMRRIGSSHFKVVSAGFNETDKYFISVKLPRTSIFRF